VPQRRAQLTRCRIGVARGVGAGRCLAGAGQACARSTASWAVSGALAVAAGVTAGAGGAHLIAVAARVGVVTAFLVRAVTGLTGQTCRLVSWTPSRRCVDLDRRWYGPACGLHADGSRLPRGRGGATSVLNTAVAVSGGLL